MLTMVGGGGTNTCGRGGNGYLRAGRVPRLSDDDGSSSSKN